MPRHFAVAISTKLRRAPNGGPVHPNPAGRIRNLILGFVVLVVAAAALFVGSIIGTAVALTIGALVLIAFMVLLVRGMIDLRRNKPR